MTFRKAVNNLILTGNRFGCYMIRLFITGFLILSMLLASCKSRDTAEKKDKFTVDDVVVGTSGVIYVDPEFLSSVNRMVFQSYTNGIPCIWITELDPDDGLFRSQDGLDLLVDSNVATLGSTAQTNNGPEFTAKAVRGWLNHLGVKTLVIERGSSWEDGYIESLNRKLRDEILDREILTTPEEA